MRKIDMSRYTTFGSWLRAGLAIALGVSFACVSSTAHAMDWTEINTGNVNDWTGFTDSSKTPHSNFFNQNSASGNTLTIQDRNPSGGMVPGTITGHIYGGYSSAAVGGIAAINSDAVNIDGNSVTVYASANPAIDGSGNVSVYGGYKDESLSSGEPTRTINGNSVTIHSGVNLVNGDVAGAKIEHASRNTVESMANNTVTIYGGTMRKVAGAAADIHRTDSSGDPIKMIHLESVDNNTVTVDLRQAGSSLTMKASANSGIIYGADFQSGDVVGNKVYFYANNNSTITDALSTIIGGRSGHVLGEARNNTVVIDFTAKTIAGNTKSLGIIKGGSSGNETHPDITTFGTNNVYDNNVYISGSTSVNVEVDAAVGGKTYRGKAENNNVYLTDVKVNGVIDAGNTQNVGVAGGYAVDSKNNDSAPFIDFLGVADNNNVYIVRGEVSGDIYGGFDASSVGQSANGNTVTITDATVNTANVYGGRTIGSGTTETSNNSVHITGRDMIFNVTGTLAGGSAAAGDNLHNNTLTTSYSLNLKVGTISDFENYVYNMTSNEMEQTVYVVSGAPANIIDSKHTLNFDATQGPPLYEGQILTLIDRTTEDVDSMPEGDFTKNIKDGFLYNYDSYFGMKGNSVVFEILGRREDERNVTFGQSQLVGLQMANIASDLARSIPNLFNMAEDQCYDPCYDPCSAPRKSSGPVVFAGSRGGTYEWNTGYDSRVNLRHISMLTGIGYRFGNLLLAGFFEAGYGKYDAKVSGYKIVDDEKSNYIGGGALARYEQNGFYGEAGFHAGRVKTDFESIKFGRYTSPVHVSYRNKSTYFGIDALAGYKLEAGSSTFDFSGRYSWNRASGDDFVTRDVWFDQDTSNSHRVRGGVEWSYNLNKVHPYAGAFYEYEFDAESGHKVVGEEIARASKKGSSGIGKLGVRFGGERGFSADLGVEGYVGKRRGVAGKAMVGYSF